MNNYDLLINYPFSVLSGLNQKWLYCVPVNEIL